MAGELLDPVDEAYAAGLWAGIRMVEGRNFQRLAEYNIDVINAAAKYRASPGRARCDKPKKLNLNEEDSGA